MNKNSPFAVWMRVSGYSSLLSLGFSCYLLTSSSTLQQFVIACVIAVLLLLLSLVVGFYFGVQRYQDKQHARFVRRTVIHHPAKYDFDVRVARARKDQTVRVTRIDTFA